MPLRRGPGAAVVNGKDIDFPMASHIGTTVGCMITQAAIDVLAKLGRARRLRHPARQRGALRRGGDGSACGLERGNCLPGGGSGLLAQ